MARIIYTYFLLLEKVSKLISKVHEKYITCVVLLNNILNARATPLLKKKLRQQEQLRNEYIN